MKSGQTKTLPAFFSPIRRALSQRRLQLHTRKRQRRVILPALLRLRAASRRVRFELFTETAKWPCQPPVCPLPYAKIRLSEAVSPVGLASSDGANASLFPGSVGD